MTMEFAKQIINLIIEGEVAVLLFTMFALMGVGAYSFITESNASKAFYEAETKYYNDLMSKEQTEVKKEETIGVAANEQPQSV